MLAGCLGLSNRATYVIRVRDLCIPKAPSILAPDRIIYHRGEMIALIYLCLRLFTLPFKSKIRLEAYGIHECCLALAMT